MSVPPQACSTVDLNLMMAWRITHSAQSNWEAPQTPPATPAGTGVVLHFPAGRGSPRL